MQNHVGTVQHMRTHKADESDKAVNTWNDRNLLRYLEYLSNSVFVTSLMVYWLTVVMLEPTANETITRALSSSIPTTCHYPQCTFTETQSIQCQYQNLQDLPQEKFETVICNSPNKLTQLICYSNQPEPLKHIDVRDPLAKFDWNCQKLLPSYAGVTKRKHFVNYHSRMPFS